jgi:hypothetical protein
VSFLPLSHVPITTYSPYQFFKANCSVLVRKMNTSTSIDQLRDVTHPLPCQIYQNAPACVRILRALDS